MTVQPATALPTSLLRPLDEEKILLGLMQTEQLKYFALVGGRHGFPVASRWQATVDLIKQTLANSGQVSSHATLQNLYNITLKIITGANHYYAIDTLNDGSEVGKLPTLSSLMDDVTRHNEFSEAFPVRLTETSGLKPYAGHFLAASEKMSDGIALIFAHVVVKKVSKGSRFAGQTYPEQYFNTVFIPNTLNRIEYRVDRELGSRAAAKAIKELRQEFITLMRNLNIDLKLSSVNFYKAINDAFKDKSYGRVVQADAVNQKNNEDANFRCRSGKTYDARFRKVVKTETGKDVDLSVEFYSVYVRFDYTTNKEEHFNEIGFETTRQNYCDNKFCGSFYIIMQSDNVPHLGVIDDILTRAK